MKALLIEKLLQYGLHHGLMEALDLVQVRNQLMTLLKVNEPYNGALPFEPADRPVEILAELMDLCVAEGIIEDSGSARDVLDAMVMAQLMPRQSEVSRRFLAIAQTKGLEAATDDYYYLSQKSNYIRMDRIDLNKYWLVPTEFGDLEITINLSKPEKDPKDIERAKHLPQSNYPKCLLCIENVGYAGHVNHPARANHRVLPLSLNGEDWFMQYSPYVYYNEHAIIFKAAHEPMKLTKETFKRLTDFVELMPHYFIGSNADLPIVGGSILSHDHFQGGHHRFPMVDAPILRSYTHEAYEGVQISIIKWPLSVIRLASRDKDQVVDLAYALLTSWRDYSDPEVNIYAYTMEGEEKIPHNTVTPIARMNDQGLFEVDLALRNNLRTKDHPDGLYHPHAHLHHIKKENIGLIEVMGLAVLPARLDQDLVDLAKVLMGHVTIDQMAGHLDHHKPWMAELLEKVGKTLSQEEAKKVLEAGVGQKFSEVLACAGVYKQSEEGINAFERFILASGCIGN